MKKMFAVFAGFVMLLTGVYTRIGSDFGSLISMRCMIAGNGGRIAAETAADPTGDVTQDGITDSADLQLLLDRLLCKPQTELPAWRAGDMNNDGKLNAADLSLLKQKLYQQQSMDALLRDNKNMAGAVTTLIYQKGETPAQNPYKGYVAWANDSRQRNMDFSLVYVDIFWNLLEPAEGEFDFASLEKEWHFDLWKNEGKRAIFRVVLDCPDDEQHMDIPQWLYNKTGDGKYYDVSYGKGYCPDYSNTRLINAHRKMLEALAERYGKDDFLAFIELGSLGHWGEWHIHDDIGLELSPEIYEKYLRQYLEVFPDTKILTRRPFQMAAENGMGLYNDSFAREGETERFISWVNEGGDYKRYTNALSPASDAWKKAPIGGEISSSIDRYAVLNENAENLTETLKALHVSFIGPSNWLSKPLNAKQLAYAQKISDTLGYDFYVRSLTICDDGEERNCLVMLCNDGCAPLYFPYDVVIKYSSGESTTEQTLDADITGLLPGESLSLEFPVPEDTESLWIALKNSEKDGVFLSNDTERSGYWQKLF